MLKYVISTFQNMYHMPAAIRTLGLQLPALAFVHWQQ